MTNQMREAARDNDLIRRGDVTAIPLMGMTVTQIERAIRAIPIAPQPVAVTVKPLTAADLSEALSCFWNAAIGASHNMQDGIVLASIMAEGIAAVQIRLQEIADTQIPPAALTIHPADPLSDPRVKALVTPQIAAQLLLDTMRTNPPLWDAMVDAAETIYETGVSFNRVVGAALRAIGGEA